MELLETNPFELVPNEWNSNRMDRDNFEKLKKSLAGLGSFKPIIVREHSGAYQILGGFHRCEAAKELGLTTVPILNLGAISDQRAKEITLIDNTRYGQDDSALLDKLLEEMDLELLSDIMPPTAEVEMPELEDASSEMEKELLGDRDDDGTHKTLKFRLEIDKAEEIQNILARVAYDNDYKFPDGFSNYAEALYHILVLDPK